MSKPTLDQLITTLKTEAIEKAEREAERIREAARQEAADIVRAAQEKRDTMIAEAAREAEATRQNGEAALRRAGRDYQIAVRNELLGLFQAVLDREIYTSFSPDVLRAAVVRLIENIGSEVELTFGEEAQALADYVHDRLQSSTDLVTVATDHSVLKGFSLNHTQEGWSYTVTPEAVAEALNTYLNPHWVRILQNKGADDRP